MRPFLKISDSSQMVSSSFPTAPGRVGLCKEGVLCLADLGSQFCHFPPEGRGGEGAGNLPGLGFFR